MVSSGVPYISSTGHIVITYISVENYTLHKIFIIHENAIEHSNLL